MKYICVTNGFKTRGCRVNNPESEKRISIVNGEILDCDGEYIVKNRIPLCSKDSILGKYHFRKVDE